MNKISTLAKSFRKNASGEAHRISSDLQSGLKQLESATATALKLSEASLLEVLKASEKSVTAAIRSNQRAQLWALRWPLILLAILALALTAWSGWQGVQVREQMQVITRGKQTLASLPVGWEVAQISGKSYLVKKGAKPQALTNNVDKNTWFIQMTK